MYCYNEVVAIAAQCRLCDNVINNDDRWNDGCMRMLRPRCWSLIGGIYLPACCPAGTVDRAQVLKSAQTLTKEMEAMQFEYLEKFKE